MKTQEQGLQEVLKKNLPQHVGEALRERLEQADRDASELATQKDRVKNLEAKEKDYLNELENYKQFDTRNALLEISKKELETERNILELEKLKYQLQSEKDKTEFTKTVALGLVRNTEYRKTIFDSENLGGAGVVDGQGNYHYPMPTNKSHTSTETQE